MEEQIDMSTRVSFSKLAFVAALIALLALGGLATSANAGSSAQATPEASATLPVDVTATVDVGATLEASATMDMTTAATTAPSTDNSASTSGGAQATAAATAAANGNLLRDPGGPFPPCPVVEPNPNATATMDASGSTGGTTGDMTPAATMDMGMAGDMTAPPDMNMTPEATMEVGTFTQGNEGCVFTATLAGENEVPTPGDPDGTGTAIITLSRTEDGLGLVCFQLNVSGLTLPAAAAHIHRGEEDVAGPVVVPFSAPDANGVAQGCTSNVNRFVLNEIATRPWAFYVNVHTSDFPAGALRGQLDETGDEGMATVTP
jgi:hypothetical protein